MECGEIDMGLFLVFHCVKPSWLHSFEAVCSYLAVHGGSCLGVCSCLGVYSCLCAGMLANGKHRQELQMTACLLGQVICISVSRWKKKKKKKNKEEGRRKEEEGRTKKKKEEEEEDKVQRKKV